MITATEATRAAERLALHGGPPAVTLDQTEALRWPPAEPEELAAAQEFLARGEWNSASPATRALEADFARYQGYPHWGPARATAPARCHSPSARPATGLPCPSSIGPAGNCWTSMWRRSGEWRGRPLIFLAPDLADTL